MQHRIVAGVIVEQQDRILMVCYRKPGVYDFRGALGGGAKEGEDLLAPAQREALEETGLQVEPRQIAYIGRIRQSACPRMQGLVHRQADWRRESTPAPARPRASALWNAARLGREDFAGKTIPRHVYGILLTGSGTGFCPAALCRIASDGVLAIHSPSRIQ
ncbi:hypothetical protein CEK28_17520 [Xenophilus sp. AP218F]|nr:hypothetical protein CEK28_17520 [Xenophilus sp. AP218F]